MYFTNITRFLQIYIAYTYIHTLYVHTHTLFHFLIPHTSCLTCVSEHCAHLGLAEAPTNRALNITCYHVREKIFPRCITAVTKCFCLSENHVSSYHNY